MAATSAEDELQQLRAQLAEKSGTEMLLRNKLAQADEELFNVKANITCMEVETRYIQESAKKDAESKVKSLESKVAFLENSLKDASKRASNASKEAEVAKNQVKIQSNRMEAKLRLEKKRSAMQMERSQATTTTTPPSKANDVVQAIQSQSSGIKSNLNRNNASTSSDRTTTSESLLLENSQLMSLLTSDGWADHLGVLLSVSLLSSGGGAVRPSATTPSTQSSQSGVMMNSTASQNLPKTVSFAPSQQHTPVQDLQPSEEEQASSLSHRFQQTISEILEGKVSCIIMLPVFAEYLTSPIELSSKVIHSVLVILMAVLQVNDRFKRYFFRPLTCALPPSAAAAAREDDINNPRRFHPRITGVNIPYRSFAEMRIAKEVAARPAEPKIPEEFNALRTDIFKAICRLCLNHLENADIVSRGLDLLAQWVQAAHQIGHADFAETRHPVQAFEYLFSGHVIQDILLSPKSTVPNQCAAMQLLTQLVQCPEIFVLICEDAKDSLLLNRISRLLVLDKEVGSTPRIQMEQAFGTVIGLFAAMISQYSHYAAYLLRNNTSGRETEENGDHCIFHHLVLFLDKQTMDYRELDYHIDEEDPTLDYLVPSVFRKRLVQSGVSLLEAIVKLDPDLKLEEVFLKSSPMLMCLNSILFWIKRGGVDEKSNYGDKTTGLSQYQTSASFLLTHLHIPKCTVETKKTPLSEHVPQNN